MEHSARFGCDDFGWSVCVYQCVRLCVCVSRRRAAADSSWRSDADAGTAMIANPAVQPRPRDTDSAEMHLKPLLTRDGRAGEARLARRQQRRAATISFFSSPQAQQQQSACARSHSLGGGASRKNAPHSYHRTTCPHHHHHLATFQTVSNKQGTGFSAAHTAFASLNSRNVWLQYTFHAPFAPPS